MPPLQLDTWDLYIWQFGNWNCSGILINCKHMYAMLRNRYTTERLYPMWNGNVKCENLMLLLIPLWAGFSSKWYQGLTRLHSVVFSYQTPGESIMDIIIWLICIWDKSIILVLQYIMAPRERTTSHVRTAEADLSNDLSELVSCSLSAGLEDDQCPQLQIWNLQTLGLWITLRLRPHENTQQIYVVQPPEKAVGAVQVEPCASFKGGGRRRKLDETWRCENEEEWKGGEEKMETFTGSETTTEGARGLKRPEGRQGGEEELHKKRVTRKKGLFSASSSTFSFWPDHLY